MSLEGSLQVVVDDGVAFTLTVANDGDAPVEVTFPDACLADVAVFAGDEERWRFSEGRLFAQVHQQRTLDPGEEWAFDVGWEDPEPGSYEAVAMLAATDADVEARASFTV